MNETQTNFPSATEAAPTLPLSGTDTTATSAPQSSSTPPSSNAFEIFTWIKHMIKAQTHLSDVDVAYVPRSGLISTWFREALIVLPCLVITGPAHEATELLRVLHRPYRCASLLLVVGFRQRGPQGCRLRRTLPDLTEPNLNVNQTAMTLLGRPDKPGVSCSWSNGPTYALS